MLGESLATLAQPDGGRGYQPRQGMHLEPTCLDLPALLVLVSEREKDASLVERGVQRMGTGEKRVPQSRVFGNRPCTNSLPLLGRRIHWGLDATHGEGRDGTAEDGGAD